MSCSEHPDAKRYYDRNTNRYRCAACVQRTILAGRKKKSLGKVTEQILDSLGKDDPPSRRSRGYSEYGLTYGDGFGWTEHLDGLRTIPVPMQKGR